ncbi:hypothetical protein [Absidia glauca]|uniref:C2H2-type domain-containing protein n=1 Tax=Absidia glauca TaxID=4829 RepID=A0A163JP44_ABSGL|nr:hypothetical protein [Absidia glauca]
MTGVPKLVNIVHQCIFCERSLSTPQKLRHHLSSHGCDVPSKVGVGRRINNSSFIYVGTSEPQDLIQKHFGCPFCNIHYEALASLHIHFTTCHPEILARTEIQQPTQDAKLE